MPAQVKEALQEAIADTIPDVKKEYVEILDVTIGRRLFEAQATKGAGRGGKPQTIIQSPNRQYKAPTDHTKPRQTTKDIKY